MKATGIVRRIDDLGRVVVPKEIRRIFTDRGTVCICKAVCGKSVAGFGMPGGDL